MRCCCSWLNMVVGPFVVLLLLHLTKAQFIQHYHNENGVPHWRRQIHHTSLSHPVLVPEYPVILEYNCWRMPAICQNAKAWLGSPKLYQWPTRAGRNVFTYDIYAFQKRSYFEDTSSRPGNKQPNSNHRQASLSRML